MHTEKRLEQTLESTSRFQVTGYLVETEAFAIAHNADGEVGVTWNPSEESPNGFPHAYSHQQWFILPEPLARMAMASSDLFEPEMRNG